MTRLVIASHNAGKVREIGELIAPLGIDVLSATDAHIEEPEETGDTFEANAALKSEHAVKNCGLPSLADDSGLVVPAIGGAPGIYSARWATGKDFSVAFARIQKELKNIPSPVGGGLGWGRNETAASDCAPLPTSPLLGEGIKAHFICVLALTIPHGDHAHTHLFEGRIDGTLTFPPRGDKGFGYDPIFIPGGYDITFGEMDPAIKSRISHRALAFEKFLQFLHQS